MLKKLSDDKIVEKDEVKWTDEVSKFFNDLLKLFNELHKCCKENELYIRIKKFLKDGYESNGFDVVAEPDDGETVIRYPGSETLCCIG